MHDEAAKGSVRHVEPKRGGGADPAGGGSHRADCGSHCRHAIASPDRIALFDGTTKLTWQALIAWAAALAEEIEALSDPASRIGIFLPGSAGYIVAILALQMAGRTAVPINHGDPEQRVGRIIGRSDLAAVIVDPDTAPLMRRIAPNLRQILAAPAPGTISVASPHCAEISPDHIFMISFTSGSTDEPKGVCWSEKSFSARLECFVPALPLTLDDRVPILEVGNQRALGQGGARQPVRRRTSCHL